MMKRLVTEMLIKVATVADDNESYPPATLSPLIVESSDRFAKPMLFLEDSILSPRRKSTCDSI